MHAFRSYIFCTFHVRLVMLVCWLVIEVLSDNFVLMICRKDLINEVPSGSGFEKQRVCT